MFESIYGNLKMTVVKYAQDSFQVASFAAAVTVSVWKNPMYPYLSTTTLRTSKCMGLQIFMLKVLQKMDISPSVVFLATLYLRKIRLISGPNTKYEFQRAALVVSLILATSFLEDSTCSFSAWSEISGIPLLELCSLQRQTLAAFNYELCVKQEQYSQWIEQIQMYFKLLI